ncbi:MAG: coenzyme F420-dependent oxidoreductase [Promethearchaeota archaeon CR_4]|nr:MAG: coenzyme F420-dependent oxidoreductase [Candidatus Lokiarchaeota archaeon CR_4]
MESSAHDQLSFSFEFLKKHLEGKKDSFGMLMRDVIKAGICTACSACVSICPILVWDHELQQPKIDPKRGTCNGCGACYNQCPRTITEPDILVGNYITGYVAKATDPEIKGQDGGVVTGLLLYLLKEKLVDGAVVTKKSETKLWWPEATIVKNREELLKASGSIYCHSQTVEKLVEAIKSGMHSLAFVGTPCNIDAVTKMQNSPQGMLHYFMRANIFKIGLFCMDSFSPEALYTFFEREGIPLHKVTKMNITKGKFFIHWEGQEKGYPIKVLDKYKATSCNVCTDLTSENADISVGSVGSGTGQNTVLVRTPLGRDILEDAVTKGYISIEPFNKENLTAVLVLSKAKKVAQYNVRVRNVYLISPTRLPAEPALLDRTVKMESATQQPKRGRNLISSVEKLNEGRDTLKITLSNAAGYVLEHLRLRIAKVEEMFEIGVFYADVPELYPFESVEFNYPLKDDKGNIDTHEILIEVSDASARLFNKKVEIKKLLEAPKEEKPVKPAKITPVKPLPEKPTAV